MARVGILSGTFDPVHKGHIAFGLAAAKAANLDKVYLAPEVKPRRKPHVTHIAHRLEMLKLAVRSQPKLAVLELSGKYFLPKTTLAHLRKKFPEDRLVLLLGSDLFEHLAGHPEQWPHVEYLLGEVELVVAARDGQPTKELQQLASQLPVQPLDFIVVDNPEPDLASGQARRILAEGGLSSALSPSVQAYATKHWLYHDLSEVDRLRKP